jgi:hypothetical protein
MNFYIGINSGIEKNSSEYIAILKVRPKFHAWNANKGLI